MPTETQPNLELLEHKLDQLLAAQSAVAMDVRSLHAEHEHLQVVVAGIPMQTLKEHEARFAPLGRFKLLERLFYGVWTAAMIGVVSLVLVNVLGDHSRAGESPRVSVESEHPIRP